MTIIIPNHAITDNFSPNAYRLATSFKPNMDAKLTRIGAYGYSPSASSDIRGYVWDTNGNLLASSGLVVGVDLDTAAANPRWVNLDVWVPLVANTVYYAGFFISAYSGYWSATYQTAHSETTVDGFTMTVLQNGTGTKTGRSYYSSGNYSDTAMPVNAYDYEFPLAFDVTLNTLPTAPTGVSATDAQWPNATPVSWTHNDPDANPQSKYQMRWRLAD